MLALYFYGLWESEFQASLLHGKHFIPEVTLAALPLRSCGSGSRELWVKLELVIALFLYSYGSISAC